MSAKVHRAILLDVGGTLIRPRQSIGSVYAEHARSHGLHADVAETERAFRKAFVRARRNGALLYGSTDGEAKTFWKRIVSASIPETHPEKLERIFEALYAYFGTADAWMVFDDCMPALDRWRARGAKLAVVSNWDARLRPLLGALGLESMFDHIVISAEIGFEKPSREPFAAALEQLGIDADAAIHIGDSLDDDITGATTAGLDAALIVRNPLYVGPDGVRIIRSLSEIA